MAPLADTDIVNGTAQAEDRSFTDGVYEDGQAIPNGGTSRDPTPRPGSPSFKGVAESEGQKQITENLAHARHSYYGSPSLTPAARTGPPRSLSFSYSRAIPSSLSSPGYFSHNDGDIPEEPSRPRAFAANNMGGDSSTYDLTPRETEFRGPFDTPPAEQRDRERDAADRRGKRKDTSRWDDFKSRWLPDALTGSPSEETAGIEWGKEKEEGDAHPSGGPSPHRASSAVASGSGSGSGSRLARSASVPARGKGKERERQDTHESKSPSAGWSRLRFLLPQMMLSSPKEPTSSAVTPGNVSITDELIVGGLSALILRLWFERDERGRRRVPVLLHRLRIRISDSLHPLHEAHSVFRIECEYANGAMRWVIYRQLRDFLSLHAHYAVSNAYNRNIEKLPEFPRTSRSLGVGESAYKA